MTPLTTVPQVPPPIVRAAIISKSLPSVTRKGLLVSYSVNEQVAGHFEVLLARSIAHRLHITGSPATGLASGTPPQLVIAKAILVTTKGGASTIKIQLSKRTSQRLRGLHKVSLMLRVIVRNAASHSPATATVLTKGTLPADRSGPRPRPGQASQSEESFLRFERALSRKTKYHSAAIST